MSGYTKWRILFLSILAILWIALSFGINDYMIAQSYGAAWQIATALAGWWIVYLFVARIFYED